MNDPSGMLTAYLPPSLNSKGGGVTLEPNLHLLSERGKAYQESSYLLTAKVNLETEIPILELKK